MKIFKIIVQAFILSLILFGGMFLVNFIPPIRLIYYGGGYIGDYLVSKKIISVHNVILFFCIMYTYLLAVSVISVAAIHAGIAAVRYIKFRKKS